MDIQYSAEEVKMQLNQTTGLSWAFKKLNKTHQVGHFTKPGFFSSLRIQILECDKGGRFSTPFSYD